MKKIVWPHLVDSLSQGLSRRAYFATHWFSLEIGRGLIHWQSMDWNLKNITTMISTWDLVMDWICMYTFYLTQIECVDLRTQAQYNLTSRVKGDRAVRPKREAWDICGRFQVTKVTSLGMRVVLNCDTMTNKWWELCTFLQIYVYVLYIYIVPNIGKYFDGTSLAIWGTGNLIGEVICHRNWYLLLFYTTAIWGQEILLESA